MLCAATIGAGDKEKEKGDMLGEERALKRDGVSKKREATKRGRTPATCAGEEGWRRGGSRRTVRRQSAALSAHGRPFPVQESAVREQDDRADLQIRS